MRFFSRPLLIAFLVLRIAVPTTADDNSPVVVAEEDLVQEILAEGRGDRDEQGVRDQWNSDEHLKTKYDMRRPISARVQTLLEQYRLDCDGCDHRQAVAKVNAFLQQAKEEAERQQQIDDARGRLLTGMAVLVTVVAVVVGGLLVSGVISIPIPTGHSLGSGDGNESRRLQIEEQRRRAAKKREKQNEEEDSKLPPPTWRENEEKEIWTDKQEKQFQSALKCFGGVAPKGRYILIAEKVDGKSRQECLMHHKLLLLKEQEQKEQQQR